MQLELTDGGSSKATLYNPNPMMSLIQDFDQAEKRVIYLILYELKEHQKLRDWTQDEVTVVLENVRKRVGGPNAKEFLKSVHKLLKRVYVTVDTVRWEKFVGRPLFSEIDYDGRRGKTGRMKVIVNRKLNDAWLNLSNGYTPQFLEQCLTLKGKYAPALFDLITKYDMSRILSWYDLRVYLAIAEEEYTDWVSFKKGVLMRSRDEIKKRTKYQLYFKVVAGSRSSDFQEKKIKIWGELDLSDIPKNDVEVGINLLKQMEIKAPYIRNYMLRHMEEFIAAYNESSKHVRGNPKERGEWVLKKMKLK